MLSGGDNETYGANKEPWPRHISPEETQSFKMNAGRESLRRKLIPIALQFGSTHKEIQKSPLDWVFMGMKTTPLQ